MTALPRSFLSVMQDSMGAIASDRAIVKKSMSIKIHPASIKTCCGHGTGNAIVCIKQFKKRAIKYSAAR
jgi:hypothetical protein